jgi:hypothetical protein
MKGSRDRKSQQRSGSGEAIWMRCYLVWLWLEWKAGELWHVQLLLEIKRDLG